MMENNRYDEITAEEKQSEKKKSTKDEWRPQDADREATKAQIRQRVRNAKVSDKTVFIPAKPTPEIHDDGHKNVAVYARVSTKSTEQVSSIENQTRYYTEKIEKTPNWTLQEIYSDEGKSGTSMRKREDFRRMLQDAKDNKMDLILCASVSRFARNVADCMDQIRILKTQNPSHPVGVYFETENIYTLDPNSHDTLSIHAMLADWESANKSRRMILSYDQRICMGQYPVLDLLGYRHTKDGELIIHEEEAKTVRYIFLAYLAGKSYAEIADRLTGMERTTLKGRTDWNSNMVHNVMTNERRWGDLDVRKTVVVDYVRGTAVKNNQIRDAAYVQEHHDGIVSPEIAKAAKLLMASGHGMEGGVPEMTVIREGALKGFVSVSPRWAGITAEALEGYCGQAYASDELDVLRHEAQILSGEAHNNVLSLSFSGYQVPYGVFFMTPSTPFVTVSRRSIRFNKKVYDLFQESSCVEILYHPVLKMLAIRPCSDGHPNAFHWTLDGERRGEIAAGPFCQALYTAMDWIESYRFRFKGITRKRGSLGIMVFYLDEPQILVDRKTRGSFSAEEDSPAVRYIPYHKGDHSVAVSTPEGVAYPVGCSDSFGLTLTARKRRDRVIHSLSEEEIGRQGTAVSDPLTDSIPSRQELLSELEELIQSM